MESEILFCEEDLEEIFNSIKRNIKKDIHYFNIHQQLDENVEQTIQKLLIQHTIIAPHLHIDDTYMIAPEESSTNINTLWKKYKNDKSNFTLVIPFSGEFELFYTKTEDQKLDIDCTGIVTKNRLLLIYNGQDFNSAEELKERFETDLEVIKNNLNCIKKAADKFNIHLNKWIRKEISAIEEKNAAKQLKVA